MRGASCKHRLAISLSFLTVLAAAGHPYAQQTQKPTDQDVDVVRVNTALVTVAVTAKQRSKTVRGLKREDFRLYEDGIEQQIVYFNGPDKESTSSQKDSANQKPLTVALLVDVSDSTELKLNQIKDAAKAFVEQLRPEDRMLLISFDQNVRVLTGATSDRAELRAAIEKVRTGRGTSVYEAVDSVIRWFGHVSGRKAVVLLTDGVDTASAKATYDSTIRLASMSDAVFYPIQFNTYADFVDDPSRQSTSVGGLTSMAHATKDGELASEAYKRAANYLRQLVIATGGTLRYSAGTKHLAQSFANIAAQLREQYTLGYYPKNHDTGASPRRIKIQVNKPDVSVNARKRYIYAPP